MTGLPDATNTDDPLVGEMYRQLVGKLMYLAQCTRADIAFAVGVLARHTVAPRETHWRAALRVLAYLRGTTKFGLKYTRNNKPQLVVYTDASWADQSDRTSSYGYGCLYGGCLVSWKSKKQSLVTLSTCEAEYVAMAAGIQQACYLRNLINGIGIFKINDPVTIVCDNQSAIAIAKDPVMHGRTKHLDIKLLFVRQLVTKKRIMLEYCTSKEMLADFMTKALSRATLLYLVKLANLEELTVV